MERLGSSFRAPELGSFYQPCPQPTGGAAGARQARLLSVRLQEILLASNPGHLPKVLSSLSSIWYRSPTTTTRPEPTRMAWSLQMVGGELNHHVYSFVQLI